MGLQSNGVPSRSPDESGEVNQSTGLSFLSLDSQDPTSTRGQSAIVRLGGLLQFARCQTAPFQIAIQPQRPESISVRDAQRLRLISRGFRHLHRLPMAEGAAVHDVLNGATTRFVLTRKLWDSPIPSVTSVGCAGCCSDCSQSKLYRT
jgi:hypothetical protein